MVARCWSKELKAETLTRRTLSQLLKKSPSARYQAGQRSSYHHSQQNAPQPQREKINIADVSLISTCEWSADRFQMLQIIKGGEVCLLIRPLNLGLGKRVTDRVVDPTRGFKIQAQTSLRSWPESPPSNVGECSRCSCHKEYPCHLSIGHEIDSEMLWGSKQLVAEVCNVWREGAVSLSPCARHVGSSLRPESVSLVSCSVHMQLRLAVRMSFAPAFCVCHLLAVRVKTISRTLPSSQLMWRFSARRWVLRMARNPFVR